MPGEAFRSDCSIITRKDFFLGSRFSTSPAATDQVIKMCGMIGNMEDELLVEYSRDC